MKRLFFLVVFLSPCFSTLAQESDSLQIFNLRGSIVASTTTSSVTITDEAINVFPNPNHGVFKIVSEVVGNISYILVSDHLGHVVYQGADFDAQKLEVDMEGKYGNFLAQVGAGGRVFTKRIVLQNSVVPNLP